MTILKVGACRSFHRVVGAREGHDVRLGGCWGAVGGVLGRPGGVAQGGLERHDGHDGAMMAPRWPS